MPHLIFFRTICGFLFWILALSCSSASAEEEETPALSNLEVEVALSGVSATEPNGDGSGEVIVSFFAENASFYRVNFGDGNTIETDENTLTYQYVGQGLKTFKIFVSAYNGGDFISEEKSISIYIAPSLIFSEEFNANGAPDEDKWTYDLGAGGWGNNESQFYTSDPDNVRVENGILKITAKKEDHQGASYTSTRLKTQGKFSFTYGKVEVRAKLPVGGGTWPAIWMLGSNISSVGWPACGEMDIMEHVGNNPGAVLSAVHTPSSHGNTQNKDVIQVEDVSSEFHVYGLNWTPDKLEFSVDGTVFYTYQPAEKTAATWPFDSDQFIILNIAIGGSLGGDIDPGFTEGIMEIDYVRVYQ